MLNGAHAEINFEIRPSAHPVPSGERERVMAAPGFGRVFTDHMITARWTGDLGWHDARLEAYGPLTLDPSTAVFHYAQEFFEGLKAYRQSDGSVAAFRPRSNAARFNASAKRLVMPELPEDSFVRALELLVTQDRDWVAFDEAQSLYLRPFMIATQTGIGISKPSDSFMFLVIASPAGAYFPGGLKPVTVWVSENYIRAAPGGTGATKCGGNYAGGFIGQIEATEHGCDQVVWLDAVERKWVEEMGGMNIFFVYGSGSQTRIVTPPLGGTLLPGITRDAILTLAGDLGIGAEEDRISVDQWRAGCASGEITEAFACGTAAAITPIGRVKGESGGWTVGNGESGELTLRLRDELLGIQYGHRPDPYGWVHKIC
ncbi:MAG TPA: branched-chain amino acid aminotransferase [Streptosporangiaceae bacterium]|jgi:branched-chain amino acid aminotransferase|nr:branched-chain amino acid aminotransferase [Streptosporangiaceae bacterium]